MNYWKTGLFLVLVFTFSTVFGYLMNSSNSEGTVTHAAVLRGSPPSKVGTALGDTAPDFQLKRMDGATVALSNLRGQPAVLVFWASWCPVCKEEAPHINELVAQYEPRGVRVLGINILDNQARAEAGIKNFGIRYPVVRDADASVARRYKVTGTPTIVFLDRNGVVRYFGNELPQDYPQRLDALIAEKG